MWFFLEKLQVFFHETLFSLNIISVFCPHAGGWIFHDISPSSYAGENIPIFTGDMLGGQNGDQPSHRVTPWPRDSETELLDTQGFLGVDRGPEFRSVRWRFLGMWKNSKTAPCVLTETSAVYPKSWQEQWNSGWSINWDPFSHTAMASYNCSITG